MTSTSYILLVLTAMLLGLGGYTYYLNKKLDAAQAQVIITQAETQMVSISNKVEADKKTYEQASKDYTKLLNDNRELMHRIGVL